MTTRNFPDAVLMPMLRLIAEGHTDQEIADRMHVSVATVARRKRALLRRMGARNRAHLVALAVWDGLITIRPADDGKALPVPIGIPGRSLLWYRTRLAVSVLRQRASPASRDAALQVLEGQHDNQFIAAEGA